MAVVLIEFPCSFNGVTSETMHVGEERDFGSMTAGLVGMGWISDDVADAVEPEPVVVVDPATEPVLEPVVDVEPTVIEPVIELLEPVIEPVTVAEPVVETEPVIEPTPEPVAPAPQAQPRRNRR